MLTVNKLHGLCLCESQLADYIQIQVYIYIYYACVYTHMHTYTCAYRYTQAHISLLPGRME